MGIAAGNILPDGSRSEPSSKGEGAALQPFDGFKAIEIHLDQSAKVKDYICARTKEIPDVPLACYSDCVVAKWLHSEHGKECDSCKLPDSVCKRCEEFHEIAAQLVLLTKMGMPLPALEVVKSVLNFASASSRFQSALAELHVECRCKQVLK